MNMWMLPYANWFEIANLVVFPLAIYFGSTWGRGQPAAGHDAANND